MSTFEKIAQNNDPRFTPNGLKVEGTYENERNKINSDLFKAMIREAYGAGDVIIAHHLTYVAVDNVNGYDYQIVEEIPSADTLIFDHEGAKKIWGDQWQDVLVKLVMQPVPERDKMLARLYQEKHFSGKVDLSKY